MIERKAVEKVIGKTFADHLDEVVFEAGTMSYSRRYMVEILGCANFIAAVKLAKVLRRLSIQTSSQLYRLDPASLARTKGIGESCMFVAMCILDAADYDVLKWWEFKRDNVVKFSTFKSNVMRRAKRRKQEVA